MTATPARKTLGQYREFSAPEPLATIFDYFWLYQSPGFPDVETFHRVLPDPDSSIVLLANWPRGQRLKSGQVVYHGPITSPYVFQHGGVVTLISAKIKSEWIIPLLGTRADEVSNYTGPLNLIDKPLAERLEACLLRAASWPAAMAGMAQILTEHCYKKGLFEAPGKLGLVQAAGILARRAKGALSTAKLARTLEVSERQLFRRFQGEVGLSPKDFTRRLRFLAAVTLADAAAAPDWAGIAAEAGYFDQSHMIRDFKALSALTPRAVFSERRAESLLSNTL